MKPDKMIEIPLSITYRWLPDGKLEKVRAEYATVSADAVARFLLERFNVPFGEVDR